MDSSNAHPIRVVARRTGLSVHVIRVWERRYGAVVPLRTCTGRRLYTDSDIERLTLLKQAAAAGHGIGSLARHPTARIAALVNAAEDVQPASVPLCRDFVECCAHAIEQFDVETLQSTLRRARMMFGQTEWIERLVVPLLHHVGDLWHQGVLRPAQEHLASAVVRAFLEPRDRSVSSSAPGLVVATPSGQLHEIGAMMVAATASMVGWNVIYLGSNLPAEDIALASRQRGATAVALSIVYPSDDSRLVPEIATLRRLLGDLPVVAGGRAAADYRAGLERLGVRVLGDLRPLRQWLDSWRVPPPPEPLPGMTPLG